VCVVGRCIRRGMRGRAGLAFEVGGDQRGVDVVPRRAATCGGELDEDELVAGHDLGQDVALTGLATQQHGAGDEEHEDRDQAVVADAKAEPLDLLIGAQQLHQEADDSVQHQIQEED
jgi:hypothetical protein